MESIKNAEKECSEAKKASILCRSMLLGKLIDVKSCEEKAAKMFDCRKKM